MLTEQQRARLAKAVNEMRHGPGYQDIQRFIVAEVNAEVYDHELVSGLLDEVRHAFGECIEQEAQAAYGKRKATGR